METHYSPLVLKAPLNDTGHNNGQRLPQFDGIGPIATQKNVNKMNEFMDLEEVDHDDFKIRFFSQIFPGEVKKWYRGLEIGSFIDLHQFHQLFLS